MNASDVTYVAFLLSSINVFVTQISPFDISSRIFSLTAFREVFDLFDSNGGGSIDAEELDEALRSADIHLTKEEITEVLSSMDKDGLFMFCALFSSLFSGFSILLQHKIGSTISYNYEIRKSKTIVPKYVTRLNHM